MITTTTHPQNPKLCTILPTFEHLRLLSWLLKILISPKYHGKLTLVCYFLATLKTTCSPLYQITSSHFVVSTLNNHSPLLFTLKPFKKYILFIFIEVLEGILVRSGSEVAVEVDWECCREVGAFSWFLMKSGRGSTKSKNGKIKKLGENLKKWASSKLKCHLDLQNVILILKVQPTSKKEWSVLKSFW